MTSNKITVGIFWFLEGQVYGATESLELINNVIEGKVDSKFEHWDIWENTPELIGIPHNFQHQEYFSVSRGRVIFDTKINKHVVYCDPVLLKNKIKALIVSFFSLNRATTVWSSDPHYTTEQNKIDTLWETDT